MTRVPLSVILDQYRPGSYDATGWSWEDEEADILARECCCCDQAGHYQEMLEDHLRTLGRVEEGILLGNDGRVWDGHHRITAARRLGLLDLPLGVESHLPVGVNA